MAREGGPASKTGGEGSWHDLAEELKEVLRWAAATERHDVGTRAMLIGMVLSRGDASYVVQALGAAGQPISLLFSALQNAAPVPRIDPNVRGPLMLEQLPPLSPNGARSIRRAMARRDLAEPGARLGSHHLFGALLELKASTAYQALEAVLGAYAPMERIRATYDDHLLDPHGPSFQDRLVAEMTQGPQRRERILELGYPVRDLAFSPDGRWLATASSELRLWSANSRNFNTIYERPVVAVDYSRDNTLLAHATADGQVFTTRVENGPTLGLRKTGSAVTALAFTPSGRLAYATADGAIAQSAVPRSIRAPTPGSSIDALAASPRDELLAAAGDGGVIWVFDAKTGEQTNRISISEAAILDLAFSPRDGRLAYATGDGRVGIWDVTTKSSQFVARHAGQVYGVAFSADGSQLASVGEDGVVRISDPEDFSSIAQIASGAPGQAIAFSPTEPGLLATGGIDGVVHLWDLAARSKAANDSVEWLSDGPARVDMLGRKQLARALAKRLERASTLDEGKDDDSFLIHVDGPWGTGKSSVLGFLEEELCEGDGEWMVVKFDAWRQARVGPPWWALLTSLRKALRDGRTRRRRLALRASETFQRLWRDGASYLLSGSILAIAVIALLVAGPASGGLGQVAKTCSAVVAAATTLWVMGRVVARFLMWDSATAARLFEQSHQDPMESLAEHFAWLLSQADGRVIFFVDDLDRCDSDYVVDLLDSIQTLVRDAPRRSSRSGGATPHPYFVIAADGRWIRRSYEGKHESFEAAVSEPGRPLGYLFLDKIFQLTVRIPAIGGSRREAFLKHLLDRSDDDGSAESTATRGSAGQIAAGRRQIAQSQDQGGVLDAIKAAPEEIRPALTDAALDKLSDEAVERATEHELQKFAPLLEPNPRSMKRFVNAYSMALSALVLEGREAEPDQLALWTIVCMRWPDLADHLRTAPLELDALDGKRDGASLGPEHLRGLAGHPDVVRVVSFGGLRLTPAAIGELCGVEDPAALRAAATARGA